MSSLFGSAAYAALEAALNRLLALDGATPAKLAALEGARFLLDCTQPPLRLHLLVTERGLLLSGGAEAEADTTVRGSAAALAKLLNDKRVHSLHGSGLEVRGDLEKARQLQDLLGGLRIDWEYQLAKALGDIPTHFLAQALRGGLGMARQNGQRVRDNVDDYLHEERRLTPDKAELEDFFADIHALRLDVDRLAARISLLESGQPLQPDPPSAAPAGEHS